MAFAGSSRFELLGKLGEGGMGIVYEALDRQRNINVALKTLRQLEATSLYRFKREFRAVSDLSHPNIVSLYELVADDDEWFFTMEVVRGGDIIQYVRTAASADILAHSDELTEELDFDRTSAVADGVVPGTNDRVDANALVDMDRVRYAFGQLARALWALHEAGLVHRDLKPSNVRVTDSGRVVLMDFGIVADRAEGTLGGRTNRMVGTPAYMAPEQILGDPPTAAADWYAFGVMLYLALSGELPFSGSPRRLLRAKMQQSAPALDTVTRGVPEDLRRLCTRLLDRRPRRRPPAGVILAAFGLDMAEVSRDVAGDVFVGRAEELEVLTSAFQAARGHESASVFVIGDSGMGKSTLVRRFIDTIESHSHSSDEAPASIVLCGRCHERESLSFNAFDGVIDSLSHALLDLPESLVESIAPADIGLLTRLFPVLLQVPRMERAAIPDNLHPRELRSRAARALGEFLRELARLRPVVIYIDDLQWADRDSLELLDVVMSQAAGLFFIATLRPDNPKDEVWEAVAAISQKSLSHRLTLGPLSAGEQRALIDQLIVHHPSAGALAHTSEPLGPDAGTSPLFLVELVRFMDEAGDHDPAGALKLDEVLSRRLMRLPDEARVLLQATAVAGEPTPYWALAQAGNLAAGPGQHALMLLRSSRLVRIVQPGADPWITTNHALMHDAVLASLSARSRRDLHAGLAAALDSWEHASVDALAHHWRAAGNDEKARTYLVSAARDAAAKLAFDRAAELYGQAIELAGGDDDLGPLLRGMGDALQLAGRSYEAATTYERAATTAPPEQALELQRLAADEWLRSGHMKRGLERLAAVMSELGIRYARTRTGAIASVLVHRARLSLRGRHYDTRTSGEVSTEELSRIDTLYAAATTLGFIDHLRGTAVQTYHVLTALDLGEEHRVCRALALEYGYFCTSGRSRDPEVEELGAEVLAHAQRLGDAYTMGVVLLCWGTAQFFSGRAEIAVRTLIQCDELLRSARRPVEWERRTGQYMLSLARIATGVISGKKRADDHYVAEAERSNDVYARTMFLCLPGTWSRLGADEPDMAHSRLDTAVEGWPDDAFYVAGYVQAFARVMAYIYEGKGAQALAVMDEALPRIRKLMLHRVPWVWSEINTLIARAALLVDGRPGQRRARKAMRVVARAGMTYTDGVAALVRAALHHRGGHVDAAVDELRVAEDKLDQVSARHLVAATRMRLGQLTGGAEGKELMDKGEVALRECGAVNPWRMLNLLAPGFAADSDDTTDTPD